MDKKKIKVFLIGLVIVGILFFVAFYIFKKGSSFSTSTTTPTNKNTESSLIQDKKNNSQTGAPLTQSDKDKVEKTGLSLTQADKDKAENKRIVDSGTNNTPNDMYIKSSFEKFLYLNSSKEINITSLVKKDSSEKVSLDDFSRIIGIKINTQLKELLNLNDFYLFSCPQRNNNMQSMGIVLTLKLMPEYNGSIYYDELAFLKTWEKSMFKETSAVLFPKINLTPENFQQSVVFKDGAYRYAEVLLPNNKKSTINYEVVADYIIISNNKECLKNASESFFDTSG